MPPRQRSDPVFRRTEPNANANGHTDEYRDAHADQHGNSGADLDANPHDHVNGDTHANRNRHAYGDGVAESERHAYADQFAVADTHDDSHRYAHAVANANRDRPPDRDGDSKRDAQRDEHRDSDAFTDIDCDVFPLADADVHPNRVTHTDNNRNATAVGESHAHPHADTQRYACSLTDADVDVHTNFHRDAPSVRDADVDADRVADSDDNANHATVAKPDCHTHPDIDRNCSSYADADSQSDPQPDCNADVHRISVCHFHVHTHAHAKQHSEHNAHQIGDSNRNDLADGSAHINPHSLTHRTGYRDADGHVVTQSDSYRQSDPNSVVHNHGNRHAFARTDRRSDGDRATDTHHHSLRHPNRAAVRHDDTCPNIVPDSPHDSSNRSHPISDCRRPPDAVAQPLANPCRDCVAHGPSNPDARAIIDPNVRAPRRWNGHTHRHRDIDATRYDGNRASAFNVYTGSHSDADRCAHRNVHPRGERHAGRSAVHRKLRRRLTGHGGRARSRREHCARAPPAERLQRRRWKWRRARLGQRAGACGERLAFRLRFTPTVVESDYPLVLVPRRGAA